MVELHNYQEDLLDQVETALNADAKARVMMQLPTGGGKTEIAGQLLKARLTDGCKAVWVTHRRELTEQTCERLIRADVPARVEKSWNSNDPDAPVVPDGVAILMAQTLGQRTAKGNVWGKYGADDLMVVDEVHHAPAPGWERTIKQWPGQVLGMTATPWRMSKKQGFDHLFNTLICGPQVADLQSEGHLCNAIVKAPLHEHRIRGGELDRHGDYRQGGIVLANSDRPDVMTARALRFWQEHVGDRKKTIVYAVSKNHAHKLKGLFDEEGIGAGLVLGAPQPQAERNRAIEEFKNGSLEVLINVAVVTEGFDVPEASCIVITRPTLSLALFMQMVGRGLRSKDGGGDCLILDLADNTKEHGFPETRREWKLEPRGNQPSGEAPVVWCRKCYAESHAASQHCKNCGHPLGQKCTRCKWRPWRRWYGEDCEYPHDLVCDLCHADAHVRAHIPVSEDLIIPLDDLVPDERPPNRLSQDGKQYWHLLSPSLESNNLKPETLLTPHKEEIPVWNQSWRYLLTEVAEWLVGNSRLPANLMPIVLGAKRHVVHTLPKHADDTPFEDWEELSNGLFLYLPSGSKDICKAVEQLNRVSPPDEQFYVSFKPYFDYDVFVGTSGWCHHFNPGECNHPRD